MDAGSDRLTTDIRYLHSTAENIQTKRENEVNLTQVNAVISRLSVVIAQNSAPDVQSQILDDLRVVNALVVQKTTQKAWTEGENRDGLPLVLSQGIATCFNLLNPNLPPGASDHRAYHGLILREAIANKEQMGVNKSPRECVRQYCLDILRSGCETYKHTKLYLIRDSSSVIQEGYPSIVLSHTKVTPPASQEDIGHMLIAYNPASRVWFNTNYPDNTFSSLKEVIGAYIPDGAALCAPGKTDVSEYVGHYMQSAGYLFSHLEIEGDQTSSK